MSFLSGPKQQAPSFTGLDIQTSTFTLPIPIAYGRNRFAPNVIWSADFAANKQKQPGGKGGGASTGFTYRASLILGLCEGPVSGVPTVWISSSSNIVDDIESLGKDGMTLFNGASGQSPWGYVTARYPAQALAYPSTAYVCAANYDLGTNAQVPNHDMEVVAILAGTGINGQSDADPAQVAEDFLTNPTYGVGFPASAIDSVSWYSSGAATSTGDAAWQTYCRALGIDFSPVLNNQEQASDTMTRWAQLTNTAPVISGAALKMIPFGDLPVSGNGYAYVPNVAPVYALTDRDYVRTEGEDPVLLMRSDQTDAYNCWRIEYSDRTDSYNNVTIEAKDQNSIEVYGLRVASTVQGHEIVSAAVAQLACNLILQRAVGIRNTYAFKLSQEYFLLEPMDLVTLTDSGLGLNASAVRITEIEEDDSGIFTVTAEEFPAGTATAVTYPLQPLLNTPLNSAVVPASVNPSRHLRTVAGAHRRGGTGVDRHQRRRERRGGPELGRRTGVFEHRQRLLRPDRAGRCRRAPGRPDGQSGVVRRQRGGYGRHTGGQHGGKRRDPGRRHVGARRSRPDAVLRRWRGAVFRDGHADRHQRLRTERAAARPVRHCGGGTRLGSGLPAA